jgi:beta-N-acetylhexosaminidase
MFVNRLSTRSSFAALAFVCLSGCATLPTNRISSADGANKLLGKPYPGIQNHLTVRDSIWVEQTLASLTLREKAGQLIMPWVGGEYAAVGSPEYEQVRKWVDDDKVGGLVLSIGMPLSYAAKLNEMQRRSRLPLLIASDMENGAGMRMGNIYAFPSLLPQGGGTVFPPVMSLGATGSEDLAYKLGVVLGREARAVGVQINFGPVLDVNSNPVNPIINTRSFGEDPTAVSALATAYIRGARSAGLMTTGKHFPGHGDTGTDSHIDLPVITADREHLNRVDFPPFQAAIKEGIDGIMTAHIAVVGVLGENAPPATLSPVFMTQILRNELGFHGLLFTDAMTMGGVSRKYGATEPLILALNAGADILLMPRGVPEAIETIVNGVQSGRVKESRIDEAVRLILTTKAKGGLVDGRLVSLEAVDSIVNIPEHAAIAKEIAERSITLARDNGSFVPLRAEDKRILSITYAGSTDVLAGRIFNDELSASGKTVRRVSVDARTPEAEWNALRASADSFDVVLASAYVLPVESAGSVQIKGGFPGFVESVSTAGKRIAAISFGSPYLLSAFPSVPSYMLAWGGAPLSQRAAAQALLGKNSITGHLPVSLPPSLKAGDGLTRNAPNNAGAELK